jgi:hypothetical protein
MIKESREFKDLDYPDKDEGIEKLKDVKGNFFLCPCKDIIIKMCSSSIVSPQNKEGVGTPTSKISLSSKDPHSHHSLQ